MRRPIRSCPARRSRRISRRASRTRHTRERDGAAIIPPRCPIAADRALAAANGRRHDWYAEAGRQRRDVRHGRYRRVADRKASTTDPDASLLPTPGRRLARLGYRTHYVVDGGKARIILAALVTPAEVMENQPMLDLLWHSRFRWHLRPHHVTGDTTYGTLENVAGIEDAGIRAYLPIRDANKREPLFGQEMFTYDARGRPLPLPARRGADARHPLL